MQQVAELFFVLSLCVRARRHGDTDSSLFENAHNVVGGCFPSLAELGEQLPPNLLDFGGRESWFAQFTRGVQDEILLGRGSIGRTFFGMMGSHSHLIGRLYGRRR